MTLTDLVYIFDNNTKSFISFDMHDLLIKCLITCKHALKIFLNNYWSLQNSPFLSQNGNTKAPAVFVGSYDQDLTIEIAHLFIH